jgi:rhodanese-related sulfurtransferase
MLMVVGAVCAVALVAAVFLIRRTRGRRNLEQHSIAPEALHALMASNNNDVALFDVRLPLDLLGHSVVIPGARRLAPDDVIANPSLIPRDRESIVYCTCPSDETSQAILQRALALGFEQVKFLRGGLEGWKARGFPVEPYNEPFHLRSANTIADR